MKNYLFRINKNIGNDKIVPGFPSPTPTLTQTPTITPTLTPTPPSPTTTPTPSITPTITPTITITSTLTPTLPLITPTLTLTPTITPTFTITPPPVFLRSISGNYPSFAFQDGISITTTPSNETLYYNGNNPGGQAGDMSIYVSGVLRMVVSFGLSRVGQLFGFSLTSGGPVAYIGVFIEGDVNF